MTTENRLAHYDAETRQQLEAEGLLFKSPVEIGGVTIWTYSDPDQVRRAMIDVQKHGNVTRAATAHGLARKTLNKYCLQAGIPTGTRWKQLRRREKDGLRSTN